MSQTTERVRAASARPAHQRSDLLQSYGPTIALALLTVLFAVASPQFRTLGNVQSVLDTAAVLAVVTIGITFILLLGSIDLSITGVMAACAMAVALLAANSRTDLDLGPLAVLLAVALGGAFGLLNGLLAVMLRIPTLMTTLGMSAVGLGVATLLFSGVQPTVTDEWLLSWATGRWFGFTQLTYVAAACVLLAWFVYRHTRLGRYVLAIGGGEDVMKMSGIRPGRYRVAAFALAGCCYGLAAVMVTAQLGSGIVQAGVGMDFSAIAAAVVGGTLLSGGRGGVLQSTVGVLLMTVLANGLVLIGVSLYVQNAVQGVIVVAAVAATLWPVRHQMEVVK